MTAHHFTGTGEHGPQCTRCGLDQRSDRGNPCPAHRWHLPVVERVLDEEHSVILTLRGAQALLTPAEAEQLAEDLMAAAATPVPCATGCGRLAEADYCGQCQDAGAGEVRRGWGA